MIQVTSYSSAVGSEPNNQRLSMEQASAVTAILRQSGVPLANVIVSAAMGLERPDCAEPDLEAAIPEPPSRRHAAAEQAITGQ